MKKLIKETRQSLRRIPRRYYLIFIVVQWFITPSFSNFAFWAFFSELFGFGLMWITYLWGFGVVAFFAFVIFVYVHFNSNKISI